MVLFSTNCDAYLGRCIGSGSDLYADKGGNETPGALRLFRYGVRSIYERIAGGFQREYVLVMIGKDRS
jgi:hypothetical protein